MELLLTDRLAILSHPQRMSVFRLLMRRYPDALPAGEISNVLALKPSSASVYLSALTNGGLIRQQRDGRSLLYSMNLDAVQDVVSQLFFDCCRGRADLCLPQLASLSSDRPDVAGRKYNVLFVCTGNSARSLIAETILRDMAGDRFDAYSAGTAHRTDPNPLAIKMLRAKGHDVATLRAKNVSEFQHPNAPNMDFVLTVCDAAANEDCPTWHGQPISGHWGMPDPAKTTGTEAQIGLAFQQTYGTLHNRLAAFTELSFDALDRATLQKHVDQIGTDKPEQDQTQ